jgi:hypothetical protein
VSIQIKLSAGTRLRPAGGHAVSPENCDATVRRPGYASIQLGQGLIVHPSTMPINSRTTLKVLDDLDVY